MKTQEYKEAIIGTHDDFSPCYPYQLKITQPMEQLIEKWNMTDADDFNLDGIVDMVHLKVMVTRYTNSHQSVTTSLKSTSSSNYLRLFLYNLSDNLYYLKRIVERGYRNAKHETDAALFLKVGMGKL
jgi:hypothetical protein